MQVARLQIQNFRGIQQADVYLSKHAVLVGDNNTGKTTILEALDLVLGPDRLSRSTVIDEHDFYLGKYLAPEIEPPAAEIQVQEIPAEVLEALPVIAEPANPAPKILITVTVIDLSLDQIARFGDAIEFWDRTSRTLYAEPAPEGVDAASITNALRISFEGLYDEEEDDFIGNTYFTQSMSVGLKPDVFSKKDKQFCGFLYLRSVRTGSRALSLEKGSLLDIILRLKEVRPQMWEETISKLDSVEVASNPELGISGILESINSALKKYVPKEWGVQPHLKVSNLTREHLR